MKKIILGIIIGLGLSLGGIVAAQSAGLIQVPAFVGGYSTIDLLTYLSQLKAKDDASLNGCKPGNAFNTLTGRPCHSSPAPSSSNSGTVSPSSSSGGGITSTPTQSIMLYTITPSTNPLAPIPPAGSLTEQQVRDFSSTVNEQTAWKVACQSKPIDFVISSMEANGYAIEPVI